jgi:hypothetical protein
MSADEVFEIVVKKLSDSLLSPGSGQLDLGRVSSHHESFLDGKDIDFF